MKKIRFSFVSSVSGDLQVLQVTYSTENTSELEHRTRKSTRDTHVTAEDILDLLLLESTFDDEATSAIYASCGSHLSK